MLHYARTWFIIDILTVGVEWVGIIASAAEDDALVSGVRSLLFFCRKKMNATDLFTEHIFFFRGLSLA